MANCYNVRRLQVYSLVYDVESANYIVISKLVIKIIAYHL